MIMEGNFGPLEEGKGLHQSLAHSLASSSTLTKIVSVTSVYDYKEEIALKGDRKSTRLNSSH